MFVRSQNFRTCLFFSSNSTVVAVLLLLFGYMSYKQVNSLALSVSRYQSFDRVARYMFYLQKLGNQQRSQFWRDLSVGFE